MRIILATDPPWAQTANARQMNYLAEKLRDDLHTVYWMPVWGFSDGGMLDWNGITVLPGDNEYGNRIMKHHVRMRAAQLVITRGNAELYPEYGGSDFAWWAWHPGKQHRRLLRKTIKPIAVSREEKRILEDECGVWPHFAPRAWGTDFGKQDKEAEAIFRHNHNIPGDAFLISAIGANTLHWKSMLEVFKKFSDRHENAMLYMHTEAQSPLDLIDYAYGIGLSQDKYRIPDSYNQHMGYWDGAIGAMYRASHVTMVPGKHVMPILESMASGTPVLTTRLPEAEEIIRVEGLGAMVEPALWLDGEPVIDVDGWVAELENAYAMDASDYARHREACRMTVKAQSWSDHYERFWKVPLAQFEQEERERVVTVHTSSIEDSTKDKRNTRIVEDIGFVEEFGCEVVRKTDLGGSTQDEEQRNAIVKSWGPHPNIIPILREGEDEHGRYYFDTPKLTWMMDVTDYTPEQADKILAGVRAGLAFMHQHGAAHCDINPRNILLTEDYTPVIFDFDFMQTGMPPQIAEMCDYDPLHPAVLPYAVPIVQSGLATRGFHRVVSWVRLKDFNDNHATAKPDMPYQMLEGVGERDCDQRWQQLDPEVKGKRVLDLGCNLGYFSARSLQEGASSVEAYDRDEAIIKSAIALHPELEGSAHVMNFDQALPGGEYDVVFCLSVWQHARAGKRPMLELLKRIPVIYWEDANLNKAELEHMGFNVTRLGSSERGRNLFRLESKSAAEEPLIYAGGVHA